MSLQRILPHSYAASLVDFGPILPRALLPRATGPGSLPPAPPPRLSAALDGGLLPCLEGVLRRAARNPEDNRAVSFVELVCNYSCSVHCEGHCFLPLLAYGDVEQSAGLLSALRSLMHLPGCGGGGGSGGTGGGSGGGSGGQQLRTTLEKVAVGVASRLLVAAAPSPNTGATLGLGNSSCSGGSPVPAAPSAPGLSPAQLPLPPPPGLPRLHHMLAHAVRLLLPLMSRSVCRHATAGASEEQSQSVLLWEQAGAGAAAVLRLVTLLSVLQMKRSGDNCYGSNGGTGGGGGGDSGSNAVARPETRSGASPLARFLFDEVGVVEL